MGEVRVRWNWFKFQCQQCGSDSTASRKDARFCGTPCRQAFNRMVKRLRAKDVGIMGEIATELERLQWEMREKDATILKLENPDITEPEWREIVSRRMAEGAEDRRASMADTVEAIRAERHAPTEAPKPSRRAPVAPSRGNPALSAEEHGKTPRRGG